MRVLLDTHVFLWLQGAPNRLSGEARSLVEIQDNELVLSAASAWEIAIKHALGRLELPEPPARYVPDRMRSSSVEGLHVTHAHALASGSLPSFHRDPFDRMLIAQAMSERLTIMTADEAIRRYPIETIPAS